ncbi:MAG: hypothetical protein ACRCU3_00705 [Eubacteriaceae bacterium]
MEIKVEGMNPERHVEVLDLLLGDSDLMIALNTSETFEAGYELIAERLPGLTLEEFTGSMEFLRQVILSQMQETEPQ